MKNESPGAVSLMSIAKVDRGMWVAVESWHRSCNVPTFLGVWPGNLFHMLALKPPLATPDFVSN